MSEVVLWRCRRCGKWSHAKRDPIAHQPIRPDGPDARPWEHRPEWCGPFDRWVARHDDPSPRDDLPHVGKPVRPGWRDSIDHTPWVDAEVPF